MSPPASFKRAALLCSTLLLGIATAKEIKVKYPEKIQAAIDSASAGDKIVVGKGNYQEHLTITKNNLQLVGQSGAILTPPDDSEAPVTNGCTDLVGAGLQAGICIGGNVVYVDGPLPDPESGGEHRKVHSVTQYAENVLVKGFTVQGFSGLNIAVVGGKNVEVRENEMGSSNRYGILTVGSIKTKIARNTLSSPDLPFIGICMDDQSDVSVTTNTISGFFIGLCVQTNGADVSHNVVTNSCLGAFVDPGVDGASLTHNKITNTNPRCNFGNFALVSGIRILGARNTNVQRNDISGISDFNFPDEYNIGAGIAVYDDTLFGGSGAIATGNKINANDFSHNDKDIDVYSTGSNEFKRNKCTTPAEYCSQDA